jgi:transposase InsO family protein
MIVDLRLVRAKVEISGRRPDLATRHERDALLRAAKMHVVARVLLGHKHGRGTWNTASRLGLNSRTVADWVRRWNKDGLSITPKGPKAARIDDTTLANIETFLWNMGGAIGTPALVAAFPREPRRQLEALARAWRKRAIEGKTIITHTLKWGTVGAVWAIDFTEPPLPVDGLFPWILVVRDLASGYRLAARPVRNADAWHTRALLIELFEQHGPPLIMKHDNGKHFCNDTIDRLLAIRGVVSLVSPKYYPQYNGALEAGIGSIKTYTSHLAASQGHPGWWTCDDVEGAVILGNDLCRTWGQYCPTATWMWKSRKPITEQQRKELKEMIDDKDRKLAHPQPDWDGVVDPHIEDKDVRRRVAISQSLQELKHLTITRRRLSLPINPAKRQSVV